MSRFVKILSASPSVRGPCRPAWLPERLSQEITRSSTEIKPEQSCLQYVWDYLDRRVRTWSPLPANRDQMWTALQEEWANIEENYIEKLYESMPDCVAALLKVKGSWTKY